MGMILGHICIPSANPIKGIICDHLLLELWSCSGGKTSLEIENEPVKE